MSETAHVYDFLFVPRKRSTNKKAQLVFSIKSEHTLELIARLTRVLSFKEEMITEYLGASAAFTLPTPDLFGNTEFGFGRCGIAVLSDGYLNLVLELSNPEKIYDIALSIHMLTTVLAVPFEGSASNRTQLLDFTYTACEHNMPYGHAIGAHVSSEFRKWLMKEGVKAEVGNFAVALPKEVVKAMQETWHTMSARGSKKFAQDCHGHITRDGRFILVCPGNACDVAIYPDNVYSTSGDYGAGLSCHNLDTAVQQLTLLAGLATLSEIVSKSI